MICLSKLAVYERSNIARDPTTPSEVLVALTSDEESLVRYYLALNPATPIEVMIELAGDDDDDVSRIASITQLSRPIRLWHSQNTQM